MPEYPEYVDPTYGTRKEHIAWAKKRALEFVEQSDNIRALFSLFSDLNKHRETHDHVAKKLGMELYMTGHLATADQMRTFIEGVN